MNDFKRRGGSGDRGMRKPRFGNNNFGKKPWENREQEVFDATCANCNKDCQVPFRPTSGKPVFCKECFNQKEGSDFSKGPARRNFERQDRGRNNFRERQSERRPFEFNNRGGDSQNNNDLKKQVEMLTLKIDRLIQSIENLNRTKPMPAKEEVAKDTKKKSIGEALQGDTLIKATLKKTKKKGPSKR